MSNAILNLPQGVLEHFQRNLDLVRDRTTAEDAIFDAHRTIESATDMHYAKVISAPQRAVLASATVDAIRTCLARLSDE